MIIKRNLSTKVLELSKKYPVITITGPRQSGKTTLVKEIFPNKKYTTLEDPDTRELALSDPRGFLAGYPDGVILDEIQRVPELLSYIQGIVDEKNEKGLFILTGSQNLVLLDSISQSLAGRTAILKLLPCSIEEINRFKIKKKMLENDYLFKGFYPRIYHDKLDPTSGYSNYFETYIQRDIRLLSQITNLHLFQKFVKLCAGRIGNIFNASNLANEVGVSVPTINSWLSILEASYIIFLLKPYHSNINKRLVKSPKLYFYDVGLASYLLGINDLNQIDTHPLKGALFENLIALEIIKLFYNRAINPDLYFYRDSNYNEVDFICVLANKLIAIEVKSSQTYHGSFLKNLEYFSDLFKSKLKQGLLVYAGEAEQDILSFKLLNYKNLSQYKF
jgi:uncharacterized protein